MNRLRQGALGAPLLMAASFALACTADKASAPGTAQGSDALAAATMLSRMADSSRRAGDDADADPLDRAAEALRRTRRMTQITISVNDTPTTFMAVAQLVVADSGACMGPVATSDSGGTGTATVGSFWEGRTVPRECFRRFAPNLVAWRRAATDAREWPTVLYIHADTGTVLFGPPPAAATVGSATGSLTDTSAMPPTMDKRGAAVYFASPRRIWWATDGSMESDASTDGASCFSDTASTVATPPNPCVLATFDDAFSLTMGPIPFMGPMAMDTSTVKLAMDKQTVAGVIWHIPFIPPPPDTSRLRLRARLGARLTDAGVHFEFVVMNAGLSPAVINYPTSQRFDITAFDGSASPVWRWSSTADFVNEPAVDTIPPGKALVFSADWNSPAARGRMLGVAQLTSTNAPIGALELFTIP